MRKTFLLSISTFLFIMLYGLLPQAAFAAGCPAPIRINPSSFASDFGKDTPHNGTNVEITTDSNCFNTNITYVIRACAPGRTVDRPGCSVDRKKAEDPKKIKVKLNMFAVAIGKQFPGNWTLVVCQTNNRSAGEECDKNILGSTSITVSSTAANTPDDLPLVFQIDNKCVWQTGSTVNLTLGKLQTGETYKWWWHGDKIASGNIPATNSAQLFFIQPEHTQQIGVRTFCLDQGTFGRRCTPGDPNSVTLRFQAIPPEGDTRCTNSEGEDNFFLGGPLPLPCEEGVGKDGTIINTKANPSKSDEIIKCTKVTTAIGTIDTDPAGFIKSIFSLLLGLSGGIALFLIITSGYKLMASQGNPEKVQEAREMLTSAIVGLLFIIFSFVILQIIGVTILKIPGFG